MKQIDFLAIGDIVTDTFIHLKDAHVHCNIDKIGCELCLRFGDKVPFECATVVPVAGNSPNAAVSSARLGLHTALVTNIGDDKVGTECLKFLKKEKVVTKYIKKEKGKETNFNYVLWYDTDRTILVKRKEFTYKLPKLGKASWVYLSSISENSLEYHSEILNYLLKNPSTKLAFQPGTFQIKLGKEKLKDIYARTEIFFSNKEEAERILETEEKSILELAKQIHALGPKMVALSDGENGAYLYFNDELWQMPIYSDLPALERTGAGDAFSSTITALLAKGLSPLDAFMRGPINSMSVIQQIGAQAGLLSRKKLEEYLKNAPANYKPKKIN